MSYKSPTYVVDPPTVYDAVDDNGDTVLPDALNRTALALILAEAQRLSAGTCDVLRVVTQDRGRPQRVVALCYGGALFVQERVAGEAK